MIINDDIKDSRFRIYDPYIKTEETIFDLLKRDKDLISDDFELMPYPLAYWINNFGIETTDKIISSLKSDKIRVFICQHIFVSKLNFKDSDMIFTPHSSLNDKFITIPHYSVNIDRLLIKDNKEFDFSFLGSVSTHNTRKILTVVYPNNCFNSKIHWGLDKGVSEEFNTEYIKLLGNSNFSLCPRGTGISSVRLFESMAMDSIPIVIADNYDYPLSSIINWSMMSLTINENQVDDVQYLIDSINMCNVERMKEYIRDVYVKYFSNENLHQCVLIALR